MKKKKRKQFAVGDSVTWGEGKTAHVIAEVHANYILIADCGCEVQRGFGHRRPHKVYLDGRGVRWADRMNGESSGPPRKVLEALK